MIISLCISPDLFIYAEIKTTAEHNIQKKLSIKTKFEIISMFWNRYNWRGLKSVILFEIAVRDKNRWTRWRRACAWKKLHFNLICIKGNWRNSFHMKQTQTFFSFNFHLVFHFIYISTRASTNFCSMFIMKSTSSFNVSLKIILKKVLIRISERFPLNKSNIYHHCASLCLCAKQLPFEIKKKKKWVKKNSVLLLLSCILNPLLPWKYKRKKIKFECEDYFWAMKKSWVIEKKSFECKHMYYFQPKKRCDFFSLSKNQKRALHLKITA